MRRFREDNEGTIVFPDGTSVRWTYVEYVPYDPASYQNDEGIIVFVQSHPDRPDEGNEYYISLSDATVWRCDDDSPIKEVEGAHCPEIKKTIDEFMVMMGS